VLGDHDVDAVVTALELVGQHLAAKNAFSPIDQTGSHAGTASWHASFDLVSASGTRIDDTPADFHWRRRSRAANRLRLAANRFGLTNRLRLTAI